MKRMFLILLAAIVLAGSSAQAGFECFLEIPGVQGESTAEGQTNDITILAFAFDITRAAGGAPQRSDLVVTKLLDKASPALAFKCADGTMYQDAVLICRSSTPGRAIFYRITLQDVAVNRVAVEGATADNRPRETVSLRFSRIRWEYYPILPDGSQGPVVRHGWDFLANRPF